MRKAIVYRQRERQFDISYRANDQPLPSYNALQDPYLSGFFEKPQLKRHLKEMKLIKSKHRSKSHSKRPQTTSKLDRKDLAVLRLPLIDDVLGQRAPDPWTRDTRTASTSQRKRKSIYRSKDNEEGL